MAEYLNDDDRVLALRRWWETNGTMLVVGLVLVIAAVIGWRWYNDHTQAREEAASATYQHYLEARQRDAKPAEARRAARDARQRIPTHRLSGLHAVLSRTRRGEAQRLREGDRSISRPR